MKGKQIWAAGLAALTLSLSLTGCGASNNAKPTPRSMPNAAYYADDNGAVSQRSGNNGKDQTRAGNAMDKAGKDMKNTAKDAGRTMGKEARNAGDTAKKVTDDTMNAAENVVDDASNAVKDAAHGVGNAVKDMVKGGDRAVKDVTR